MMYTWTESKKPVQTRCEILKTVTSTITAVCLVVITITLLVAGVYTVQVVESVHPEKLQSVMSQVSSTLDGVHRTTKLLTSSRHGNVPDIAQAAMVTTANMKQMVDNLQDPTRPLALFLPHIPTLVDHLDKISDHVKDIPFDTLASVLDKDDSLRRFIHIFEHADWIHELSTSLREFSNMVDHVKIQQLLAESKQWRNMTKTTGTMIKKVLSNI